jgi:hypothetical protein
MDTAEDSWASELVTRTTSTRSEEERASRYLEEEGFSSFLYWRHPVADLVDIDLAEQEEELEAVRTELSNLDIESSTDDVVATTDTAVEKTEAELNWVPFGVGEELEKKDLSEKEDTEAMEDAEPTQETLDNAESLEPEPETEDNVDNVEKLDDNENKKVTDDENPPQDSLKGRIPPPSDAEQLVTHAMFITL